MNSAIINTAKLRKDDDDYNPQKNVPSRSVASILATEMFRIILGAWQALINYMTLFIPSHLGTIIHLLGNSLLFGFYGVEYRWKPHFTLEYQIEMVERNTGYLIGFGLITALICELASFMLGSALFAFLFPFVRGII